MEKHSETKPQHSYSSAGAKYCSVHEQSMLSAPLRPWPPDYTENEFNSILFCFLLPVLLQISLMLFCYSCCLTNFGFFIYTKSMHTLLYYLLEFIPNTEHIIVWSNFEIFQSIEFAFNRIVFYKWLVNCVVVFVSIHIWCCWLLFIHLLYMTWKCKHLDFKYFRFIFWIFHQQQ